VDFEIISEISSPETFAQGTGIREIGRLRKLYGNGHWRKRKGIATVRLKDGTELDAELHWYEASGIGNVNLRLKDISTKELNMHKFVVCLDNKDYEASLEKRKLYEVIPDPEALKHNQIRVIDESGEDYLFSKDNFLEVPLSEIISEKLAQVA